MPSIAELENYKRKFLLAPNQTLAEENNMLEEIICSINLNDKKCIDFGCGIGLWIPTLLKKGTSDILGIDSSPDAVNYCSVEYPACRFSLYQDGFSDIGNDSYEFIMANWVFQEIFSNSAFKVILNGLDRIIKPDGLLLLTENIYPNTRKLHSTTDFGDIFINNGKPTLLRFFKNNTVSKILDPDFELILSKLKGESFFELYKCKKISNQALEMDWAKPCRF